MLECLHGIDDITAKDMPELLWFPGPGLGYIGDENMACEGCGRMVATDYTVIATQ